MCGGGHPSAPSEKHQHLGGAHKGQGEKDRVSGNAVLLWHQRGHAGTYQLALRSTGAPGMECRDFPAEPGIPEIGIGQGSPPPAPRAQRDLGPPTNPGSHQEPACCGQPAKEENCQGCQSVPCSDAFRSFHTHFPDRQAQRAALPSQSCRSSSERPEEGAGPGLTPTPGSPPPHHSSRCSGDPSRWSGDPQETAVGLHTEYNQYPSWS